MTGALTTGLALTSVGHGVQAALPNTLTVTKDGAPRGKAEFEVTVSGRIEPEDNFEDPGSDSIDGDTARGIIGPENGTDGISYSGEITAFSLDGPAVVYHNGEQVDPDTLGTTTDDPPVHDLAVTKVGAPDGKAEFEVTVSGRIEPADDFEDPGSDSIDGNTARGIIGPENGTDTITYSGKITAFTLDGPALVYWNGHEVAPETLTMTDYVDRVTPVSGEVTVATGTDVLFEVAVLNFSGDDVTTEWEIDGEERVSSGRPEFRGSYTFVKDMDFHLANFTDPGTHDVHVTVFSEDGEDRLGVVEWTVDVEEDVGEAPSAERIHPDSEKIAPTSEPVEFRLAAEDPDGDLHRMIWWKGMCDELQKMDFLTGAEDESTMTTAVPEECPIGAWVVDQHGHKAWSEWWQIDE